MEASESGARTTRKGQLYRCYLVRCRLEAGAGQPGDSGSEGELTREPHAGSAGSWRFTVEQVRPDASRRSFVSIHDVAAYIDAELARCQDVAY